MIKDSPAPPRRKVEVRGPSYLSRSSLDWGTARMFEWNGSSKSIAPRDPVDRRHVRLEEDDRGVGPVEQNPAALERLQLRPLHIAFDEVGRRAVSPGDQIVELVRRCPGRCPPVEPHAPSQIVRWTPGVRSARVSCEAIPWHRRGEVREDGKPVGDQDGDSLRRWNVTGEKCRDARAAPQPAPQVDAKRFTPRVRLELP